MKTVVVIDSSYGVGSSFYITEAEIGKKTITYLSSKHRLAGQVFATATPELIREAHEINQASEDLQERGRIFREKLKRKRLSEP